MTFIMKTYNNKGKSNKWYFHKQVPTYAEAIYSGNKAKTKYGCRYKLQKNPRGYEIWITKSYW